MKIETWLSPSAIGPHESGPAGVTVVIDVLRATTVATTALAAGAKSIVTCDSVDLAKQWRAESTSESPLLLCGERECQPIEGFDFGNSPGEYAPAGVADRDLVMTTTNGTRAIEAASNCETMLLACFANLGAATEAVIELASKSQSADPVRLVCAGTNGAVTAEDVLLAGALIAMTHRKLSDNARFYEGPVDLINDSGSIALAAWQHCITHDKVCDAETLGQKLATTQGGRNLIEAGYASDLVDCSSIDVFDVVPVRDQASPARFVSFGSTVGK